MHSIDDFRMPTFRKRSTDMRSLGAFYTPGILAEWTAELLLSGLGRNKRHLVADPACGDGVLLSALATKDKRCRLIGIDIDRNAISKARRKLGSRAVLREGDFLSKNTVSWLTVTGRRLVDGIIANPPWGALVTQNRSALSLQGFELAKGQFDSFDLFVELSLKAIRENGVCVFILPDSIFLPEHQAVRRLLLRKTKILMVARLGEGFFKSVYRGTVVIVVRKGIAKESHKVTCLRISKDLRSEIISGKATFLDAQKNLAHEVFQSRFFNDPHSRFDIDLSEKESAPTAKLDAYIDGWTDWLQTARGVELSKSGKVMFCPNCKTAFPLPNSKVGKHVCRDCQKSFRIHAASTDCLVASKNASGQNYRPLIVGEDVNRYKVLPSRFIRIGVDGIDYKSDSVFRDRKILVRKTGIGLKAAIDNSGALTNQVVFIYRANPKLRAPDFLLDYFLGVLSSRVMLAYHLKKSGDNEWRSHPYVTQRIIAELPVPNVKPGTWEWAQARAIAAAVKKYVCEPKIENDCKIDNLVAGLFRLNASECYWVGEVLNHAQSLEPIRTMRLSNIKDLHAIKV